MTTVANNSLFFSVLFFFLFLSCDTKFQIFYAKRAISSLNPRGTIGNCRVLSSLGAGLVHQPPGVLEHYISYLLAAFLYCLYSDEIKSQYDFILASSKLDY